MVAGATLIGVVAAQPARAIPAFAQQTGQPCKTCHVGGFGPELTPFGREFKLGGYTLRTKSSIPVALMAIASFTHTRKDQIPPPDRLRANDNLAVDQVSVLGGGGVGEHFGGFAQVTYDGAGHSSRLGQSRPSRGDQGQALRHGHDLRAVGQQQSDRAGRLEYSRRLGFSVYRHRSFGDAGLRHRSSMARLPKTCWVLPLTRGLATRPISRPEATPVLRPGTCACWAPILCPPDRSMGSPLTHERRGRRSLPAARSRSGQARSRPRCSRPGPVEQLYRPLRGSWFRPILAEGARLFELGFDQSPLRA